MSLLSTSAATAAVLGAATVGGIFFAFSNFVMKALARLPSDQGIAAMQSINVVVLNRWFLGVFTGTAGLCLYVAGIAINNWQSTSSPWFLAGAFSYVVGTWFMTIAGNVPLNKRLADVEADQPAAAEYWDHYVDLWTKLNSGRALAAIFSAFLLVYGLILQ